MKSSAKNKTEATFDAISRLNLMPQTVQKSKLEQN